MVKPVFLPKLEKFVARIGTLPTSYREAMTYEEQILWICNYIETTLLPALNQNSEALEELQGLFVQLKNYVDNYFDNLDIQEEVNTKIDEMAEGGQLEEIIVAYLQVKGILGFDTVADMKAATNLIDGSFAETYGFYSVNDSGAAKYKVRTITNDDVVDDAFIIELADDSLIAELIIENETLNMKQVGAKPDDNTYNNTPLLLKAIEKADTTKILSKIFYPVGKYYFATTVDLVNNNLNLNSIEIYGTSTTTLTDSNSATIFKYTGTHTLLDIINTDDTKIHDIRFEGNRTNNCINSLNCNNSYFYNLYLKDFVRNITLEGNNQYIYIKNNTIILDVNNAIGVNVGGINAANDIGSIYIQDNHFDNGSLTSIGINVFAVRYMFITGNMFTGINTGVMLDARSTLVHNIENVIIDASSFSNIKNCVEMHGGIATSSISRVKIEGIYNNPSSVSGYKILTSTTQANGGTIEYLDISGIVNNYIDSEQWIVLDSCSETVIDINRIETANIQVLSGQLPYIKQKTNYNTDLFYKNITSSVSATVSGHSITYDISQAMATLEQGILIVTGTVAGTQRNCMVSILINRGTQYGTQIISAKGVNTGTISATGTTITIDCGTYTPTASTEGLKFTLLR